MRNPDRLDEFYARLKTIHQTYFPDWRFGQLVSNLTRYCQSMGKDIFFIEEDRMMQIIENFLEDVKG